MTERTFKIWRGLLLFFANVPSLVLVAWPFFWLTRTDAEPGENALLWNLGLFAAWAALHSLTASAPFKRAFRSFFHEAYERPVFIVITGVTFLALVALWRPMPAAIWDIRGGLGIALDVLYWAFFGVNVLVDASHDRAAFAGTRQIACLYRGEPLPKPKFLVQGFYRYTRHPMYFFTICMLWSASTLTAGRLLFNLCATAYFLIGAVHEERRLLSEFGDAYARYRAQVPMLIPRPNGYVPEKAADSAPA